MVYEKDKEKAELFASVLTDTFTDAGSSSDFDRNFHSYVEEFVAKFDYVENSFDKVSFDELVEIITATMSCTLTSNSTITGATTVYTVQFTPLVQI